MNTDTTHPTRRIIGGDLPGRVEDDAAAIA